MRHWQPDGVGEVVAAGPGRCKGQVDDARLPFVAHAIGALVEGDELSLDHVGTVGLQAASCGVLACSDEYLTRGHPQVDAAVCVRQQRLDPDLVRAIARQIQEGDGARVGFQQFVVRKAPPIAGVVQAVAYRVHVEDGQGGCVGVQVEFEGHGGFGVRSCWVGLGSAVGGMRLCPGVRGLRSDRVEGSRAGLWGTYQSPRQASTKAYRYSRIDPFSTVLIESSKALTP